MRKSCRCALKRWFSEIGRGTILGGSPQQGLWHFRICIYISLEDSSADGGLGFRQESERRIPIGFGSTHDTARLSASTGLAVFRYVPAYIGANSHWLLRSFPRLAARPAP